MAQCFAMPQNLKIPGIRPLFEDIHIDLVYKGLAFSV